jgi:predicted N-acetyltransferase YhbS
MELVRAEGPILEQILDASYSLWGEGLTRRDYGRYNAAQLRTEWGATHLSRLALVENGRVLASAKRYDLVARVDRQRRPMLGIGAVFTPPELRGRGFARRIIEMMIADAAARGVTGALLFSEIGPGYYARLGFSAVNVEAVDLEIPAARGTPAVPMRTGDDRDLPRIAEIAARMIGRFRFALERPATFLQYGLAKKRLLAGLTPRGARRVEFFVVEEGGQPAAYVVMTSTPRDRTLEECGDLDPSGARVGAMLQALGPGLSEPGEPTPPRLTAWLPDGFLPPQLSVVDRAAARDVMMTRGIEPPLGAADVAYWHGDVF